MADITYTHNEQTNMVYFKGTGYISGTELINAIRECNQAPPGLKMPCSPNKNS